MKTIDEHAATIRMPEAPAVGDYYLVTKGPLAGARLLLAGVSRCECGDPECPAREMLIFYGGMQSDKRFLGVGLPPSFVTRLPLRSRLHRLWCRVRRWLRLPKIDGEMAVGSASFRLPDRAEIRVRQALLASENRSLRMTIAGMTQQMRHLVARVPSEN